MLPKNRNFRVRPTRPRVKPSGSAKAKKKGCPPAVPWSAALGPVVESVKVEFAGFAPGTSVMGENVHELSGGRPEQEKVTVSPRMVTSGVTVIVYVADWPGETVLDPGAAAKAKSTATLTLAEAALSAVLGSFSAE